MWDPHSHVVSKRLLLWSISAWQVLANVSFWLLFISDVFGG